MKNRSFPVISRTLMIHHLVNGQKKVKIGYSKRNIHKASLHHIALRSRHRHLRLLLRDISHKSLRGQHQGSYARRILERRAHHFHRVDDARLYHIHIGVSLCIVAHVGIGLTLELLHNHGTFLSRILSCLFYRLLDSPSYDIRANRRIYPEEISNLSNIIFS